MEFAYTLGGGAPVVKSYMASATLSTAGIPIVGAVVATTDIGGVLAISNTAQAAGGSRQVGLTVGTTGTVAATGITNNSAIFVKAIVNPDAVYRAKLSGGATADTALSTTATTAADSTGVTLTGTTTIDDGVVWGYDGGNARIFRRADDTAGSVSINFPNAVASGDRFLCANAFMGACGVTTQAFFDLTSNFAQINAVTVDSDNDNFLVVDWELRDVSEAGTTNSFYHIVPNNHGFAGNCQLT